MHRVAEQTIYSVFASESEKNLPAMEVELRDTLRRDGLLFQSLIVRSGQGPPLPVLRLEMSAARKTGRVLICFADAGKATLADSTAWLRAQLEHYDTVLLADLRG